MPVQLLDQDAPAALAVFLAWLLPLTGDTVNPAKVGMKRPDKAPLPFWMANVVVETDDPDEGVSDGVVSVHIFTPPDDHTLTEPKRTHRHMLYLIRNPNTDIVLTDGSKANFDYVRTIEKPRWQDYGDDQVSRYVGRYGYGLSFGPSTR